MHNAFIMAVNSYIIIYRKMPRFFKSFLKFLCTFEVLDYKNTKKILIYGIKNEAFATLKV